MAFLCRHSRENGNPNTLATALRLPVELAMTTRINDQ